MSAAVSIYDAEATDGDPHESNDPSRIVKHNDVILASQPLRGLVGGGIGGEDTVLHPGDTASIPLRPEGVKVWYANAPDGTVFEQYAERVPYTGGHHHGGADNTEPAAGRLAPRQTIIQGFWPQNVRVSYLSPVVCGRIYHSATFVGFASINIFYDVRVPGLVEIPSTPSLKLKSSTNIHPSPYWGTTAFVAKIQDLANRYHAVTGRPITVTDACLEWGGRFDLHGDWKPPHAEHFYGNTADIRSWDITDAAAFQAAAAAAGISVLVEANHYHVRG